MAETRERGSDMEKSMRSLFIRTFVFWFLIGSTLLVLMLVAHADNGPDVIVGTRHADVLGGGHGPDVLIGKAGDDRLWGGKGPDEFRGGPGWDVCHNRKGTGHDTFSSCEVIDT